MRRSVRTVHALVAVVLFLSGCDGRSATLDSTTSLPPSTTLAATLAPPPTTEPTTTGVPSTTATTTTTTTTSLAPATTTTPPAATTTSTSTTTAPPQPEYVSVLPARLSCSDFAAEDLGWQVSIGYWFISDRPSRMDSDGDGIPCEEVSFPITHEDGTKGSIVWGEHLWIDSFRSGMLCQEPANEHHPSYWGAVLYWLVEGEPARMDADRDGIPCETVYPEVFIRHFLEDPSIPVPGRDATHDELDEGLYCRDLIWYRLFHTQAVGYYIAEGFPTRMDADGDGIPCETVYADATESMDRVRENWPKGLSCDQLAEKISWYSGVADYFLVHGRPTDQLLRPGRSRLSPTGAGFHMNSNRS